MAEHLEYNFHRARADRWRMGITLPPELYARVQETKRLHAQLTFLSHPKVQVLEVRKPPEEHKLLLNARRLQTGELSGTALKHLGGLVSGIDRVAHAMGLRDPDLKVRLDNEPQPADGPIKPTIEMVLPPLSNEDMAHQATQTMQNIAGRLKLGHPRDRSRNILAEIRPDSVHLYANVAEGHALTSERQQQGNAEVCSFETSSLRTPAEQWVCFAGALAIVRAE